MQRLVISEVFLRGKSQREVAATLGVTSQSVYCSKRQRWILCAGLSALGRKDCADGTALCFMQRALVTFKAAGLHSPLAGPAQEEFWLQLWVERYGALEAGLFTGRVKSWPESVIFRGCMIWTKLFMTLKKAAAGTAAHAGAPGRLSRA
ncbi:MAG: hypothetical protein EP149_00945 [Phascolarctobacterium sp.]|nr:hypothetical protein [Phascolarctobacterium sp.]